jgi:signal transduction histidine kinase
MLFAVLTLSATLLMSRLIRRVHGTADAGGATGLALLLGILIGLAALTRNEAIWLGLVWAILALRLPLALRDRLRLIAIPAIVAILFYAPWAIRDWIAFGNPLPGQALSNALSLDGSDIFAWQDPPTLSRYLAAGLPTLLGLRVTGVGHNLFDVLLLPGAPLSLIGFVGLPWAARLRSIQPLLLVSIVIFLVTALVFPVSTTWGTFLHAAGAVHVLLIVSALLALDALIAATGTAARMDSTGGVARPDPDHRWFDPVLGGDPPVIRRRLRGDGPDVHRPQLAPGRRGCHARRRSRDHRLPDLAAVHAGRDRDRAADRAGVVGARSRAPLRGDDGRRSPGRRAPRGPGERLRGGRLLRGRDAAEHPGIGRPFRRHPSDLPDRLPMTGPYTPKPMDAARSSDDTLAVRDVRIDGLRAEASEAVGYSANTLRAVGQRYRTAYTDELARWQVLRDELDVAERSSAGRAPSSGERGDGSAAGDDGPSAAVAAEAGRRTPASGPSGRRSTRSAVSSASSRPSSPSSRSPCATSNPPGCSSSAAIRASSATARTLATDVQMRIVEAQESERSRLAQEVHDGPAQVLANAIFQVEYIERVIDTDLRTAKTELRFLRDLLRRELGSVRTFISQLRPPVLDELGLDGAITDAIGRVTALTGLAIGADLSAPPDRLSAAQQTVALRVLQEALQNVRKHGAASAVTVASAIDGDEWVLTVRDDGRGFDVAAVAARGRRNFGLQFMRERAELIGARFEVHSRPDGGTLVRLAIPMGAEETS